MVLVVLILSILAHVFVLVAHLKFLSFHHINDSPEFPVHVNDAALTFVKTHRFGLYSDNSDWETILPVGDGFLYLPDHDQHYFPAHFHQLHCIRALRNYFLDVHNMTRMDFGHVDHCLVYLRELTLCNIDLTLEPATHKQLSTNGKITLAVTGVGVTHRCKDWSQVRDYMVSNYEMYKESYKRKADDFYRSLKASPGHD